MTTIPQPQQPPSPSWREQAIAKSEGITDAWEVTKTYAGRLADWVLFGCMIYSIIEILPGVSLSTLLTNVVLGVQVVMLDVGGFSLASMAEQARERGDERAARRAACTAWVLISIMILTLLLVTIGLLWPMTRPITDGAEKALILVRVILTVIYGHVIHGLRRASMKARANQTQVEALAQQVETLAATVNQQLYRLSSELSQIEQRVQQQLSSGLSHLEQQLSAELSSAQENFHRYKNELALLPNMKAHLDHLESSTTEEMRQVKASLDVLQQQVKRSGPQPQPVRPRLHALPAATSNEARSPRRKTATQSPSQAASAQKFDAKAFVFACLRENPEFKLSEIEQLALSRGQELSQPTVSRYRKLFFARTDESSTMQDESSDESSTMKAEQDDESSCESLAVNQ
jgi:hypothetical protein